MELLAHRLLGVLLLDEYVQAHVVHENIELAHQLSNAVHAVLEFVLVLDAESEVVDDTELDGLPDSLPTLFGSEELADFSDETRAEL